MAAPGPTTNFRSRPATVFPNPPKRPPSVSIRRVRSCRQVLLFGVVGTCWPLSERLVCVHGVDEEGTFAGLKRIHVITMHSAKGTEFRAVHMYAVEELKGYGLNHRELGYTAITRARTALNAFRTGDTNKPLDSAFAVPKSMHIASLFPGHS
jgi:hypothetical protein